MQIVQPHVDCQFDGHLQLPIIGVCVNKECQNKRPYCQKCKQQFHDTHINDLKNFGDLQNWCFQNSQIVEELKNYLNDLDGLVKKISNFIKATQQGNIQQNFQEMSLDDLHNSINKQIPLWNDQSNMCNLLKVILFNPARNEIENICSQPQYSNNIIQEDLPIQTYFLPNSYLYMLLKFQPYLFPQQMQAQHAQLPTYKKFKPIVEVIQTQKEQQRTDLELQRANLEKMRINKDKLRINKEKLRINQEKLSSNEKVLSIACIAINLGSKVIDIYKEYTEEILGIQEQQIRLHQNKETNYYQTIKDQREVINDLKQKISQKD